MPLGFQRITFLEDVRSCDVSEVLPKNLNSKNRLLPTNKNYCEKSYEKIQFRSGWMIKEQ